VARQVVDQLRDHVPRTAADNEARALDASRDLLAQSRVTSQA
jgi:hypothetical protein